MIDTSDIVDGVSDFVLPAHPRKSGTNSEPVFGPGNRCIAGGNICRHFVQQKRPQNQTSSSAALT
jgi:hypothetical protein